MQHIYRYRFPPLGFLWLAAWEGGVLTHVALKGSAAERPKTERTPLLAETARQLDEYFAGRRQTFDLPLRPTGTPPFQNQVWREVMAIPYGQTRSYKEVAAKIGNPPQAVRAVGLANGRNPPSPLLSPPATGSLAAVGNSPATAAG